MYCSKTRFLLVLCMFSAFGLDAMAVPSVRVLGANNSGIKAVPAKTGDDINRSATVGTVKKASVKNAGVAQKQQVLSPTTNRIGTTGATATGRLPVISAKSNVQSVVKPGTATVNNTTAAKFDEMSERMDGIDLKIDGKANITDLENYYTRDEVDAIADGFYTKDEIDEIAGTVYTKDEIDSGYYTAAQIDEKISGMNATVTGNGEALNLMSGRIGQNELGITSLQVGLNNALERVDSNNVNIGRINSQISDINSRIDNINAISSIQYVQELKNNISLYETELRQVQNASKQIYDVSKQEYVSVAIVDKDDFVPSEIF